MAVCCLSASKYIIPYKMTFSVLYYSVLIFYHIRQGNYVGNSLIGSITFRCILSLSLSLSSGAYILGSEYSYKIPMEQFNLCIYCWIQVRPDQLLIYRFSLYLQCSSNFKTINTGNLSLVYFLHTHRYILIG